MVEYECNLRIQEMDTGSSKSEASLGLSTTPQPIKKVKILKFELRWMELEIIIFK